MKAPLGRFSDLTYALLRIVAGGMFAIHGAQKIFGVLGGQAQPIASMAGAAGIIELVTGIMIMIGFMTGIAAFIASGEMAAAYFMAHAPGGLNPVQNGGEPAVLYCFVFLYMSSRGSGRYSVD
jgi:putative oxidoreductase